MQAFKKTLQSLLYKNKLELFIFYLIASSAIISMLIVQPDSVDKQSVIFSTFLLGSFYVISMSMTNKIRIAMRSSVNFMLPGFRNYLAYSFTFFYLLVCLLPILFASIYSDIPTTALLFLSTICSFLFLSGLSGRSLVFIVLAIIIGIYGYNSGDALDKDLGYQVFDRMPGQFDLFLVLTNTLLLSIIYFLLLKYHFSIKRSGLADHEKITKQKMKGNSQLIKGLRSYWLTRKEKFYTNLSMPVTAKYWVAFWSNSVIGMSSTRSIILLMSIVAYYSSAMSSFTEGFKQGLAGPDGLDNFSSILQTISVIMAITLLSIYSFFDKAVLGDINQAKRYLWLKSDCELPCFLKLIYKISFIKIFIEIALSFLALLICLVLFNFEAVSIGSVLIAFIVIKSISVFCFFLSQVEGKHWNFTLLAYSLLSFFNCLAIIALFVNPMRSGIVIYVLLAASVMSAVGTLLLLKRQFKKELQLGIISN